MFLSFSDLATLLHSAWHSAGLTRTTTTDDDRLCKIKKKPEATHLRCARFLSPRLRSRLRLVFSVGKNIILPFVKLNLLSFFLLYPVRENEISHDENWGVRGVGGGVRGWSCTGQEYLYIYIYNSETPSWLQSSDEEPVRCNGMTGCRGGRGGGGGG